MTVSMRAVPFYCPYCAEETIEPIGSEREYHCASCDRRFEVSFKGLGDLSSET
jgi:transposase-like protein